MTPSNRPLPVSLPLRLRRDSLSNSNQAREAQQRREKRADALREISGMLNERGSTGEEDRGLVLKIVEVMLGFAVEEKDGMVEGTSREWEAWAREYGWVDDRVSGEDTAVSESARVWCVDEAEYADKASLVFAHIFPPCFGERLMNLIFHSAAENDGLGLHHAQNVVPLQSRSRAEKLRRFDATIIVRPDGVYRLVFMDTTLTADECVRTMQFVNDFRPRDELLWFHTMLVMVKYNTLVFVDDEDRPVGGDPEAEPAKLRMCFREVIAQWVGQGRDAENDVGAPEAPNGRLITAMLNGVRVFLPEQGCRALMLRLDRGTSEHNTELSKAVWSMHVEESEARGDHSSEYGKS